MVVTRNKRRESDLVPHCYNCGVSVCSFQVIQGIGQLHMSYLMDSPEIPYLYGAVLTSRHQPLSLAMKRDRSDIGSVALESDDLYSFT